MLLMLMLMWVREKVLSSGNVDYIYDDDSDDDDAHDDIYYDDDDDYNNDHDDDDDHRWQLWVASRHGRSRQSCIS